MRSDLSSSYVEGPTTVSPVDPGELFRTVRSQDVMLAVVHETPPRVDARS